MLLKIQHDEALDSFLSRNRHVFQKEFLINNPFKLKLESSSNRWGTSDIKAVASAIGWEGCYGFNKLLHLHTCYFETTFIKGDTDQAYSGKYYGCDNNFELDCFIRREDIGLCLECVKSDIDKLGFCYWRRSHQSDSNVCAVHNVVLSRQCQFCGKPFNLKGRNFGLLWNRCDCGKSLLEGDVIHNEDEFELNVSRLLSDIFSYGLHINSSAAYEAILLRLKRDGAEALPVPRRIGALYESRLPPQIRSDVDFDFDWFVRQGPAYMAVMGSYMTDTILALFSDFSEFVGCLGDVSAGTRSVESTWGTYISGSPHVENPIYVVTGWKPE
ncbi:hypothetical protein ACFPU0_03060 [Pseudomonas sp. GCM10022186]|uniref:hypothetical protein n=1 Tax=Pseudomonas sp. GCM10022186 TaxID=3252650 RepID=UPI0036231970